MDEAKIEIVERLEEAAAFYRRRPTSIEAKSMAEMSTREALDVSDRFDVAALTIQSLVKALEYAERFISNGIELGFIRMPDRDDPAIETLPKIRTVLSKLRGRDEGNFRVRFDGHELWWLKNADGSGALAPLWHCDDEGNVIELDDSYAHVFGDGSIRRYGQEIGTVDDLVFLTTPPTQKLGEEGS